MSYPVSDPYVPDYAEQEADRIAATARPSNTDEIVERAKSAQKLMRANIVACITDHHGVRHMYPAWLADCDKDIEACFAFIEQQQDEIARLRLAMTAFYSSDVIAPNCRGSVFPEPVRADTPERP